VECTPVQPVENGVEISEELDHEVDDESDIDLPDPSIDKGRACFTLLLASPSRPSLSISGLDLEVSRIASECLVSAQNI
jgi:hypothetical protein